MIKVLIINSTLERSGVSNVFFDLINNSDKSEFEIQLLTLSPEGTNSRISDFLKIPVKITTLNSSRKSLFSGIGSELIKTVDEINPDIIHTNSFRATILANKYLTKYLRVSTIHGVIEENHSVIYGQVLGRLMAFIELRAFQKANLKTVVSKFLSNHYQKFGEVKAIANGVDESKFFRIEQQERALLRSKNNIPLDSKVYVFSGNLIKRKNPLLVISAFIKANIENSFLIVLGDGPLMEKCRAIALPNVLFFGHVNDVAPFYQLGDVFISASNSEGFGLSVIEAARCGLNCIVTNLPPHIEIFENNTSCVRFFEVNNESQLIQYIKEPIGSLDYYSDENYTVTAMAQKYQNEYKLLYLSHKK